MTERKPQVATFAELDSATLYALLRLRVDVFVVEQRCPYPELDGRDTEPGTRHVWLPDDSGAVLAYLRILDDPDGAHIGRVVTARHARGRGLAARLMETALELVGDRPVWLHAQTHAVGLYTRFGFSPEGEEFLDDGIPHIKLVRRR